MKSVRILSETTIQGQRYQAGQTVQVPDGLAEALRQSRTAKVLGPGSGPGVTPEAARGGLPSAIERRG